MLGSRFHIGFDNGAIVNGGILSHFDLNANA
jgi:hypothetical protein